MNPIIETSEVISIDTESYLKSVIVEDKETKEFQKRIAHCSNLFEVENMGLLKFSKNDTTFNFENDLHNGFNFLLLSPTDEFHNDPDCIVVYQIHLGGDSRGNYGSLRVGRPTEDFYDWYISWCLEEISDSNKKRKERFIEEYPQEEDMKEFFHSNFSLERKEGQKLWLSGLGLYIDMSLVISPFCKTIV